MERVQDATGRGLQVVQSLADGGVGDGHWRRLARQRAEPDQLVSPDFNRFAGLGIDCDLELGQRNDLRWQRQKHLALAVLGGVERLEFRRELGCVDGFGIGCADA